MGTFIDLCGERFGKLVVEEQVKNRGILVQWACRCDCGGMTLATTKKLRSGRNRSCGCLWLPSVQKAKTKHGGAAGGRISVEMQAWMGMRGRCNSKRNRSFANYGGRGIYVCERWEDFAAFRADMGPRPSAAHSLERVDNDGPYSPENCVWATRGQQARNRRNIVAVTFNGKTMCARDASRASGIKYGTLLRRAREGWPAHRLFLPVGGREEPHASALVAYLR